MVGGLPVGKTGGKHSPLASGLYDIADGGEYGFERMFPEFRGWRRIHFLDKLKLYIVRKRLVWGMHCVGMDLTFIGQYNAFPTQLNDF